jgi:hypothetical protein
MAQTSGKLHFEYALKESGPLTDSLNRDMLNPLMTRDNTSFCKHLR